MYFILFLYYYFIILYYGHLSQRNEKSVSNRQPSSRTNSYSHAVTAITYRIIIISVNVYILYPESDLLHHSEKPEDTTLNLKYILQ